MSSDSLRSHQTSSKDEVLRNMTNARSHPSRKVIAATTQSTSRFVASERTVEMLASSDGEHIQGISTYANIGTLIRGPVGFTAMPWNIKMGGVFSLNVLSFIPSTAATPIPSLLFLPPFGAIKTLTDAMHSAALGLV